VKRERPSGAKEVDSPRHKADRSPARAEGDGKPLMSTGVKSGFLTGDELNANIEEVKRRRKEMFANASKEMTGEGAETIYRAKDGTQVDREEWLKSKEKKKRKERPEQTLEWGTGVVQKASLASAQDEAQRVAAEPMARYEIRKDVDEELRGKSHWDDPLQAMAAIEQKSRAQASASAPKRPQCRFPAPPNRFGIKPGYRWDGKVRGNDYEKRWFKAKGDRKHRAAEGYAWSTEDM